MAILELPSYVTIAIAFLIFILSFMYDWFRQKKRVHDCDAFMHRNVCNVLNDDTISPRPIVGRPMSEIPGPAPTPGLGNLGDIMVAGSFNSFLNNLHKDYGDIAQFFMKQERIISVAEPELFRKTAREGDRPLSFFEAYTSLMKKESLAFLCGKDAQKRRTTFDTTFSHRSLPKYVDGLKRINDDLTQKWLSNCSDGHHIIQVKTHTLPLAMRCILQELFGSYFREKNSLVIGLQKNFEFCWRDLERRSVGDVPEKGSERDIEFEIRRQEIFEVVDETIEDRIRRSVTPGQERLIDLVMDILQDEPQHAVTAELVNVIIGAYLSMGDIMTWLLYFLAKHPEAQQKIYDEFKQTTGNGHLSFETITKLRYMRQFMDESLRVSLLGTLTVRKSERHLELDGYHIPPDVPLVQAMGVVHMDPRYYPDPKRFDPDRFSVKASKDRPQYAFVPFGFAGGRSCPGHRFAYLTSMVFMATIIRDFHLSLPSYHRDPEVVFGVITCIKDEFDICLTKRSDKP